MSVKDHKTSYINRIELPTNKELKQKIRNANKRLERVSEKFGTRSSAYETQRKIWKENYPSLYQELPSNQFKLSTNISNLQFNERKELFLDLPEVKGVLDLEYEAQEMLKEDSIKEILLEEGYDISDENPQTVNRLIELQNDFKKAIETYQNKGYTAEELGVTVLNQSHKSYSDLFRASQEIWQKLTEKQKQQDYIKNEGARLHEQQMEDYYRNKYKNS